MAIDEWHQRLLAGSGGSVMKRGIFFAVFAAMLLSWLAHAADQPSGANPTPQPAVARDHYDLVFLGDTCPVLIRLHIRIDGRPLQQAWDDFIDGLFRYLDRDGNGVLSQEELQRVPRPQFLLSLLGGNLSDMAPTPSRSAPAPQVSLVPDQVTRAGLAGYYRLSGIEPFAAFIHDKTSQAEALTDALFKTLDLNHDGKLSKEELLAAASSLRVLDVNDDELISIQEILPNPDGNGVGRPAQREVVKPLSNSTPFVLLSPDDSPTRLASLLLDRYDKDQNQKLSRTEITLDRRVFDQLDLNHDNELDAEELTRFLNRQPIHIELILQLAASGGQGSIDIYDPLLHASATGSAASPTENKPLVVKLAGTRIDAQVGGGPSAAFASIHQSLLAQFASADVDQQGYLDHRQIQGNPFFAALFPATEEERESKLAKEEFTALVDLLGKAVAGSAVLTITDQGHGLFELLNTHQDGRLRQRELKLAWARLAPWDRDGGGQISRMEIPHLFHLRLSQGPTTDSVQLADGAMIAIAGPERKPAGEARGPLWFYKMDRNGDGEISLREWLGSKEDFQRIDTNGDGVISLEEAKRADAEFRKQRGAPSEQK
jgi:Ca2+-binding EF-hand superfamily protein